MTNTYNNRLRTALGCLEEMATGIAGYRQRRLLCVGYVLIVLCCLAFASCTRKGQIKSALASIREYNSATEMSLIEEFDRIQSLKATLKTVEGIDALALTYHESNDYGYKERLLFFCWGLTYEVGPDARDRLVVFLKDVVTREDTSRLRICAARGLVLSASPEMEDTFASWFESEEETMWRHGARGLWQIGSDSAINTLIGEVQQKRSEADFVSHVREMVSGDSNRWTSAVLDHLNHLTRPSVETIK